MHWKQEFYVIVAELERHYYDFMIDIYATVMWPDLFEFSATIAIFILLNRISTEDGSSREQKNYIRK